MDLQGKGQITALLVDPLTATLDIHSALLKEMGLFNHMRVENGVEALAIINNLAPAMVLAQQNTPLNNGLTLLRLIREQEGPEKEPVFILYGKRLISRQVNRPSRIGANAVIMMPCQHETIKAKIQETLSPPPEPEALGRKNSII